MKNKIKKMLSTLLLTLTIVAGTLPAKDANAGLIVLAYGAAEYEDAAIAGGIVGVTAGIGFLIAAYNVIGYASKQLSATGTMFLFLNADSSLSQNVLEATLSKQYSFIDNHLSISKLAMALKSKVPANLNLKPGEALMASLSEEEVREAVVASDLSDVQIDKLIQELGK